MSESANDADRHCSSARLGAAAWRQGTHLPLRRVEVLPRAEAPINAVCADRHTDSANTPLRNGAHDLGRGDHAALDARANTEPAAKPLIGRREMMSQDSYELPRSICCANGRDKLVNDWRLLNNVRAPPGHKVDASVEGELH